MTDALIGLAVLGFGLWFVLSWPRRARYHEKPSGRILKTMDERNCDFLEEVEVPEHMGHDGELDIAKAARIAAAYARCGLLLG